MVVSRRTRVSFAIGLMFIGLVPGTAIAGSRLVQGPPLLLFGGRDHSEFLGCLKCYRSDTFSVWNENGEYGDPASEKSIWNQHGPYGSRSSPTSPWNPEAEYPPLAVDRQGNVYGYLTLNVNHPGRARRNDSHPAWANFELLVWLLDNYDWVITHLEEVRSQY